MQPDKLRLLRKAEGADGAQLLVRQVTSREVPLAVPRAGVGLQRWCGGGNASGGNVPCGCVRMWLYPCVCVPA